MSNPDPDREEQLDAILARIGQRILEKDQQEGQGNKPSVSPQVPARRAQVIQFPLWPEPLRGMPNPTLRCALFAAVQGKTRRFLDNEPIATINGIEIRFLGKQLNQEDLDVCAEVVNIAKSHPAGDTCHTSAYGLLKSLGRSTGNSQHVQLHQSLLRLCGTIEIKAGRYTFFGSILIGGVKDEITRHYIITINPKFAALFAQGWTALDARQRRCLRRKPLALWLHAFYSSHAQPFSYKVETLRQLSGSRTIELFKFRQNLRYALNDLERTSAITSWLIEPDSDLVQIQRPRIAIK